MVTKIQFIKALQKNDDIKYDEEKDIVYFKGTQVDIDKVYQDFLKKNGMSFNCICDVHFECMSILECTECGTVIRYFYDEFYEPNFKCPVCTDYKTGYEYHTKEEIENSEELQAVINMYREFDKTVKEQDERIQKRNGLHDWQLSKPKYIRTKNGAYRFSFLVDSILNKNKLKGLRLEVAKLDKEEPGLVNKWNKIIPLSVSAVNYHRYRKIIELHPELDPLEKLKGKSLSQTMEEAAVLRMKTKRQ